MPPLIRVLLLDDDPLTRNALRSLLATEHDLQLIAEITQLEYLFAHSLELQPQIVLIGGQLKPFVFDLPRLIKQLSPQTKLIALLNPTDPVRTQALLTTNLAGCLFRQEIDEYIVHALRAVAQGGTWFSRAVVERLIADQTNPIHLTVGAHQLTQRDKRLLTLLGGNYDNAQIAAELQLKPQTVRNYISSLCKKLGLTRAQLAQRPSVR